MVDVSLLDILVGALNPAGNGRRIEGRCASQTSSVHLRTGSALGFRLVTRVEASQKLAPAMNLHFAYPRTF